MAKTLCPDKERATIALSAVAILAFMPGPYAMAAAIVLGGSIGLVLGGGPAPPVRGHIAIPVSRRQGLVALACFATLLIVLPLIAGGSQTLAVIDSFYRAGALVFGGGHVVLPLLQAEVVEPGWITPDIFLAGYGAAQAVPGPLFTFAAYLGTALGPEPNGILGASLALLAIFLPGFLILIGILPFWDQLRSVAFAQAFLQGANAAVVGILGAALYTPVFTSAIGNLGDFSLALACFVLLVVWKIPPWGAVLIAALGGTALRIFG